MDLQQQRLLQNEVREMERQKKKLSIAILTALIGLFVLLPLTCINKFYLGETDRAWRRLIIQSVCLLSIVVFEWGGIVFPSILLIGPALFYLVPIYDIYYALKYVKKHNDRIETKIMNFLEEK